MARKRMIDPSIWDDEDVGALSSDAFKLFIALISQADDEGKIEVSARRLMGVAFRFNDHVSAETIHGLLTELSVNLRSVAVYTVDGREYVKLMNWHKYQTINRPSPSKFPEPPDDGRVNKSVNSMSAHGVVSDRSCVIEKNRIEEKRILSPPTPPNSDKGGRGSSQGNGGTGRDPVAVYQAEISPTPTDHERRGMDAAVRKYGVDMVVEVIEDAAVAGARGWGLVAKMLQQRAAEKQEELEEDDLTRRRIQESKDRLEAIEKRRAEIAAERAAKEAQG